MTSLKLDSQVENLRDLIDRSGLRDDLPDARSDQGTAPRKELKVPIWVRPAVAGPGAPGFCGHSMIDISDTGVGFLSRRSYEVGQHVFVEICVNGVTWTGEMSVAHCTEEVPAYRIGLRQLSRVPTAVTLFQETRRASDQPTDALDVLRKNVREQSSLSVLKTEVRKAMRAYQLARSTWGLLGTSVRKQIQRVISGLPESGETQSDDNLNRQHARCSMAADARLVVELAHGWRQVPIRTLDVSEGGIGFLMPPDFSLDTVERELSGDVQLRKGTAVIIGLGAEPETLWVPAEVMHCQGGPRGLMRVGAQFATPGSLKVFGGG